jgi:hypothetical protein
MAKTFLNWTLGHIKDCYRYHMVSRKTIVSPGHHQARLTMFTKKKLDMVKNNWYR